MQGSNVVVTHGHRICVTTSMDWLTIPVAPPFPTPKPSAVIGLNNFPSTSSVLLYTSLVLGKFSRFSSFFFL